MKKMRLRLISLLLLFILTANLTGCAAEEFIKTAFFSVEVASVSCDISEYAFTDPSQSVTLSAAVTPENATDKTLIFESSNTSVCTVDSDGKITPVSDGVAYVSVYPVSGLGSATCRINVNFHVYTEGVTVGESSVEFTSFGESKKLSAIVLPVNATNPTLIWTTGDSAVATVDQTGTVTAVGNGETLVEAVTEEGGFASACRVNVSVFIDIADVEFDIREFTFSEPEDTLLLTPQFVPENTTERGLKWSSSDENVATVTPDGVVTATGNGNAVISALSANGKKVARCNVTVKLPVTVTGIRTTGEEYTIEGTGQNYQLIATVLPTTADNKKLIYESSDAAVATVTDKGVITSAAVGECVITVTSDEGGYSKEFKITVIPKVIGVTGVSLKTSKYTFTKQGETFQLQASVLPSDAAEKGITYKSGDTDIVTVDENGLVTAVGYGITYVAVTSKDGSYTETFYAVFSKPVEEQEGETFISKVVSDGEVRGVWVSTVSNIDFPSKSGLTETELKNEINKILDNVVSWGFNTVFFQVRPKSDALYYSSIFPSSDVVVAKQGDPLPFDILKYFIEQAHSRGLELHAWLNPYRISQANGVGQKITELAATNPARLHPEWVVMHTDGAMYYNPAIPEVRELIVSGIEEIIKNYDVDGIHFDDYFYPSGSPNGFADDAEFEKYGNGMSLSDWRRSNVDTLVLSVSNLVKNVKPSVKFGISPGGIWAMQSNNENGVPGLNKTGQSYYDLYADTRKWVLNEWIDYVCPQIYWNIDHASAPFKNIAEWWGKLCAGTDTELYIGIAAYRGNDTVFTASEYKNELAYLKTIQKCNGAVFFTYNSFVKNLGGVTDVVKSLYVPGSDEKPITVAAASDKLVLFNSKQTVDSGYSTAFILGVSDPAEPLSVNGVDIPRTAAGYFAYFASDLKYGENKLTFTHKGTDTVYVITRKQKTETSEFMDSFGFVSGTFSPKFDYASASGTTLTFSCNATAGAVVYATVGDYRVDLKTTAEKATDGKYRIGWYEGKLTLPQTEGNLVLGTPVFYAEMDGKTEKYTLTNTVEVINDPSSYTVRIVKDKCDLIPNLSVDPDDYYFGTVGAMDTVVSKSKGYIKLSSGYYVNTGDVERTEQPLAKAVAGNITLTNSGEYTHVIIPLSEKSNHVVWQYDDRTEIIVYNVLNPSAVTVALAGGEKLFSAATAKAVDDTTLKITLTYRKEFNIFGYYTAFDGDRLTVNYRNPAVLQSGSRMLSGIRISIDPGHSDSNGALGCWGTQKGYEAEFNLTLSRKVAEKLAALGADVKLSHNGEQTKDLDTLIKEFREWSPDLNVSIHFNSISSDINPNNIQGTETYYSFAQSKLLAQTMLESFTELTGLYKRSAKPGYYKVSRFTDFPSILFETAFMCNPTEYEWFMEPENMNTAATAIVAGIVAYFTKVNE